MYLPILFFVIFATVQASMLYLGNQAASAAAREAARVARSGGGSVQARQDAVARGEQYAASVGRGVLEHVSVVVVPVAGGQVRAVVTGHGIQVVPGLPTPAIRQVSQGPVEQFRPDV
jgi:Flp pilus assembly protein TadG